MSLQRTRQIKIHFNRDRLKTAFFFYFRAYYNWGQNMKQPYQTQIQQYNISRVRVFSLM